MFDPKFDAVQITNYARTQNEMELFLCFTPAVAGKTSAQVERFLADLLRPYAHLGSPLQAIYHMECLGILDAEIKRSRLGKHTLLRKSWLEMYQAIYVDGTLDPLNPTVARLTQFHGIGPKSARMIVLHSVRNARVAVLDVHILKWLKANFGDYIRRNYGFDVPDQTPSSKPKVYDVLEAIFVGYAEAMNLDCASLDLNIWLARARAVETPVLAMAA